MPSNVGVSIGGVDYAGGQLGSTGEIGYVGSTTYNWQLSLNTLLLPSGLIASFLSTDTPSNISVQINFTNIPTSTAGNLALCGKIWGEAIEVNGTTQAAVCYLQYSKAPFSGNPLWHPLTFTWWSGLACFCEFTWYNWASTQASVPLNMTFTPYLPANGPPVAPYGAGNGPLQSNSAPPYGFPAGISGIVANTPSPWPPSP